VWRPAIGSASHYALVRECNANPHQQSSGNQHYEQWLQSSQLLRIDFYTPEQHIGAYDDKVPWVNVHDLGTHGHGNRTNKIKIGKRSDLHLAECAAARNLADVGRMQSLRCD